MKFDTRIAIYLQLIELFEERITIGYYKPGETLPSRREVASEFGVNPNTVQRAFSEMESLGLIESLSRQQTIVTTDEAHLQAVRSRYLNKKLESFVQDMQEMNLSKEEVHQAIDRLWQKEDQKDVRS